MVARASLPLEADKTRYFADTAGTTSGVARLDPSEVASVAAHARDGSSESHLVVGASHMRKYGRMIALGTQMAAVGWSGGKYQ